MINQKPKTKSAFREWLDSIAFAVVAATFIRWLFLEAYTIPTGSMEKSLLIGDFLFVSKMHYGARTPKTPIQIPLTHQTIWGTQIPSFSDIIQLPSFRLPGFSEVKRNDVVVFNYPGNFNDPSERPEDGNGGYRHFPVDLRTNFVKRCIGVGGDIIEVKAGMAYINGKLADLPQNSQFYYVLESKELLDARFFETEDIQQFTQLPADSTKKNIFRYQIKTTPKALESIKKNEFVASVTHTPMTLSNEPNTSLFPGNTKFNMDFWGPIQIPKEGLTITLDSANVARYGNTIKYFDLNEVEKVIIENNKIKIDGKVVEKYTFKQNYYFMMGDNRYESADSRVWGFVPADHIVGKAVFIWMSIDPNPDSFINKIRWKRLFSLID